MTIKNPLEDLYHYLHDLVVDRLWLKVIIGLILGIIAGVLLGPTTGLVTKTLSETLTSWFALPGFLFLRLVQMIMIPLIVASIIQGVAGGKNKDDLKKMGPNVGLYFLGTTIVAVVIGVVVAYVINPGLYFDTGDVYIVPGNNDLAVQEKGLSIPVIISELLPNNPLASMVSGEMMNIVIFALISGIAMLALPGSSAEPVMKLLSAVQEICMVITKWAMKLAPFAVFGLITQITARVGIEAIAGLGMYILAVLAGLLMLMVMYSIFIISFTNIKLGMFYREVRDLLLLAFSVASSAAVMPMSLKTVEEKFHVNSAIARFIIPVGATINMNGTAAYQAIATIFLAQVYGLDLNIMSIILLVVTTVLASIGTPSTPGAGVIILATVLSSVGIPIEGIALIIGVDNILGMCRTAVNVTGDVTACLIFDRIKEGKKFPE